MRPMTCFLGIGSLAVALCLPAMSASAQSTANSARLTAADDLPAIVLAHIEQGDEWIANRKLRQGAS